MKHVTVTNVNQFFDAVEKCAGSVELVTKNGDQLELKSLLCQFVSMTRFFAPDNDREVEIIIHNASDEKKLRSFMIAN